MARPDDGALPETVRVLAESAAAGTDVEVLDVDVRGYRNSRIVRIIADADGGLDVDRIAGLSRDLGRLLEEQDVIAGSYTLEVSSPGVDRPLTAARDFRRNVGRTVRVSLTRDDAGELQGDVIDASDDAVTLEVDGEPVELALSDIRRGTVVLPW